MSDRYAQIVRLLETRDDELPLPTRRNHTPRGFVSGTDEKGRPLRWLTCEDCLANDRPISGCEGCGGTGLVPDLGPDPYQVNEVQPYGITGSEQDRRTAIDAAIARAKNDLLRFPGFRNQSASDELAEANRHPYGWEIARRRMYKAYDYAALDAALELLRQVDDGAYRALHATYVYGWADPTAGYESAIARGLEFLAEHLPDPLRAPTPEEPPKIGNGRVARAAGRDVMAERDEEIRRAVLDARLPTAAAAATWHLTVRQVNRICEKEETR